MPLLISRAFPEASLQALRVCLEYMIVSLLLEQLTDVPATTPEAQKWANIFKQAFKQTLRASEDSATAILKQLRKLKRVLLVSQPPTANENLSNSFIDRVLNTIEEPYRSYLVESNILLAEGMVKEAADRENPDTALTLKTYMEARRMTIGIRPIFEIGRWIYGLDIAHEVLTHPDILHIEKQMIDLVFLANDLYSYKKECFACGAHHNYITIALRDPITGLRENDRQGAIDYTCRKFCEVLGDVQLCRKVLPRFGESEDTKIALYIDMMMDVVVANIQWSLATLRYGHFEIYDAAEAPVWGDVVFELDAL
ncbi:hypothetical protein C0993_009944 [Termitomyces sp. T159_Od127]|nr:hypothetical protein C0993_009944 [Termitomyces sp. T159_Od127]